MSALPRPVAEAVERIAGAPPQGATRVGGGCINDAARVDVGGRPLFVKWHGSAPPGFFEAEADGLERLAAVGAGRVPRVVGFEDGAGTAVLVMEHVPAGRPSRAAMADAGRRLALQHAERGLAPGLERDNFIGSLPQPNAPSEDGRWTTFFRERRLLAMSDELPARVRRRLEDLDVEALVPEPDGGCSLLHGDLWGGNLLCDTDGRGWLIDPAVYRGHPEVDLAMTRLFGGFERAFYDAYQEVAGPFDAELGARLDVLNLYPLLVHVRLFGGGYLSQVEATLDRYGA